MFLGRTGSGKTTLFYGVDREEELIAEYDSNQDILSINTRDNKICHDNTSDTKIPIQRRIQGANLWDTVWDTPGFNDTGGPVQEIANAYYIREILKVTEQLKIILVVQDSGIRGDDKCAGLISAINGLISCFKDIEPILDHIVLVVTNTGRNPTHVKSSIENLLKKNSKLAPEVVSVLNSLMDNEDRIRIFKAPKEEGEIINPPALEYICSGIKYLKVDTNLASASISPESMDDARILFDHFARNFNELSSLIFQVILNAQAHIYYGENNLFILAKEAIDKMIPSEYTNTLATSTNSNSNFTKIALLDDLKNRPSQELNQEMSAFITNFWDNGDKFTRTIGMLDQLLQIIANYSDDDVRPIIIKAGQALKQQAHFVLFFSDLCKEGNIEEYGEALFNEFIKLPNTIAGLLEESIKSIDLMDDQTADYYDEAVKYLQRYSDDDCIEKQALASSFLGDFYGKNNDSLTASTHYIHSVGLNPQDSTTYNKLGHNFLKIAKAL